MPFILPVVSTLEADEELHETLPPAAAGQAGAKRWLPVALIYTAGATAGCLYAAGAAAGFAAS